jgi:hypothetical protein
VPAPERSDQLQDAVYWQYLGIIDGEVQLAAPVLLSVSNTPPNGVRWNQTRRDAKDPKGQKITLDASLVTSQRLLPDSLVWPGTLDEWHGTGSGSGSGAFDSEVMQVVTETLVPDIKGREVSRKYGLMRYRGVVPS